MILWEGSVTLSCVPVYSQTKIPADRLLGIAAKVAVLGLPSVKVKVRAGEGVSWSALMWFWHVIGTPEEEESGNEVEIIFEEMTI